MAINGVKIGIALTGSFCTIGRVVKKIEEMVLSDAQVHTILSKNVAECDTRFGTAKELISKLTNITGKNPFTSIVETEPIGPSHMFDVLLVAPCTGNTLAKIAYSITDGPVTMAVKSHLRNGKPVVLALSTNDALAGNAKNIGQVLSMKNIYFVPMKQDDPNNKPRSLSFIDEYIIPAIEKALRGEQIQPIIWGQSCEN